MRFFPSSLVGGCRPCRSSEYLLGKDWKVKFRTVVVAWGVASEVLIAVAVRDHTSNCQSCVI